MRTRPWLAIALVVLSFPVSASAADTTPPSTPTVTDGGAYTSSLTELSVGWVAFDPESPDMYCIVEIRRDSISGLLVDTRPLQCAPLTGALFGSLSLEQNRTYYFGVKARNSDGLWSGTGWSNGIRTDTTAPSAPGRPTEGSLSDLDYDADGAYTVYWPAAADAQSGIAAYELQERAGVSGIWTTLTSTTTARTFSVSGRSHNVQYVYQVRAKNGAGTWSAWSAVSDGMRVDKTAPSSVTVTDDGAVSASTTQLHAAWTASTDAESGITGYYYQVRRISPSGPITVNWMPVGLVTDTTITGLTLAPGSAYYIGIRSRNGAGTYAAARYSDGILIQGDAQAPQLSMISSGPVGLTTANVSWTTDEPATTVVDYGPTPAYGQTVSNPVLTTSHGVTINGLALMTTYHVRVRSADAAGNVAQSGDLTFDSMRPGPSVVSVSGRQLLVRTPSLVDGSLGAPQPYVIRGVTWSPASQATNTTTADPNNAAVRRPEFGAWYLTDIPLLQAMRVNTVRLYIDPGITSSEVALGLKVLDELYRNGIMVIMTADNAVNDTSRIPWVVSAYRSHPAILMWSLGNEWNINRYYGVASSVLDAAQRTQSAAATIKGMDTLHPVVSSYGEIAFGGPDTQLAATQNYVNTVCPSVDVWGLNLYRGRNFTTLWPQWTSITGKPMFIGEFGVDAYDSVLGAVNQAAQTQWDLDLWNDLVRNLSAADPAKAALGGTVFEWNDEWWKVYPPGSQETGGWSSAAFPDGVGNEEYFGIVDINRNLRQVYGELQRAFDPAYVPPARTVTFQAVSRGTSAAEWIGQYGVAKFLQDGTLLYSRTGGGGGGRGFNVAAVNAATGAIVNPGQNFDTWGTRTTGAALTAMVNYLAGLPANTLVLVAVADDAGLNLDNSCTRFSYPWVEQGLQALEALGSTQIRSYCFRNSFAFAAVTGQGARAEQHGSGIEASAQTVLSVP